MFNDAGPILAREIATLRGAGMSQFDEIHELRSGFYVLNSENNEAYYKRIYVGFNVATLLGANHGLKYEVYMLDDDNKFAGEKIAASNNLREIIKQIVNLMAEVAPEIERGESPRAVLGR